ncbi:putative rRNA maturation protein [Aspergillus steynii IBT 23096]|uniref:Putative rRNA maturation protein n=1 Tax=Aspergillus steynii IBT 23096 TaxID=1392250 RepID=A0A2I2FVS3_9EURO|nr:putative rRNA maturation protein [Aspergillus steynii IBT 23096]PLB44717.1 putative rRNA maturation protein [Aspergillus steynii IBT 23096]
MPPSQLKQLKASLRDTGVLGPQQSKKKKRQDAKSGVGAQNRVQRNAALQAVRDRFNPFEIKTTNTRSKFDVTTRDSGSKAAGGQARPGVTKSLGEEKRRQTLLRDMERRKKVGGLLDRRFGENDPTMTPEERAAERFAKESQRKLRKESMFNLEEDDEEFQLTHKGESLSFGEGAPLDDFQEGDLGEQEDDMSDSEIPRKRKRFLNEDGEMEEIVDGQEGEDQPERKKSKHEVMKEVIAKSKFHKLERQQAKEDDDDLREELDKGLPDLFDMLRGIKPPPKPEPPKDDLASMNPDRAALLNTSGDKDTEKEYDQRLKQLTFDKRSMPTDRTKTAEEKAEEEAQRLKALEEERVRRMRGEDLSDEDEDEEEEEEGESSDGGNEMFEEESLPDDARAFGLQQTADEEDSRPDLGVEDEDDFIIDDDLVETRSDVSLSVGDSDEEGLSADESEEEDDELVDGVTLPEEAGADPAEEAAMQKGLAYTYPCPGDHAEFLQIIKDVPVEDIPTVIQRIRALHHSRLQSGNKTKLGHFAAILVEHVAYMAEQPEHPPFAILENILRHVHSLAKTHSESVSLAFRARLREIATDRPLNLRPSDLVVLTGVGTIFPTSDHFHAVTTPAHLCLARYLGQGAVNTLSDFATGTYAASLVLQYQTRSKRYMPELINYALNALVNLAPKELSSDLRPFPLRSPQQSLRLATSKPITSRKLQFWDVTGPGSNSKAQEELKLALITTLVQLLDTASDLWADKPSFTEVFEPVQDVLRHLSRTGLAKASSTARDNLQLTLDKIERHLSESRLARRPLLLHYHRPLAIKTAIPKFEETFNPDKHYDPNRERAELSRLKAEHKRERKGAIRELRKDANFIAREQLREKRERDAEYERKYKRLVADVQNEEGREANAYEKEKRMRQGKW